jgi:SHS2 domain-containing protein
MKKYEFLEHTADVKFRSYGKSLENAFLNAGSALKEVIVEDKKIKDVKEKSFFVSGSDKKSLLREFLEEFLYLLEGEDFIFGRIKSLKIKEGENLKLKVKVLGDKASNYSFSNPVKAVTYNQMQVKKGREGWICQVVLDV